MVKDGVRIGRPSGVCVKLRLWPNSALADRQLTILCRRFRKLRTACQAHLCLMPVHYTNFPDLCGFVSNKSIRWSCHRHRYMARVGKPRLYRRESKGRRRSPLLSLSTISAGVRSGRAESRSTRSSRSQARILRNSRDIRQSQLTRRTRHGQRTDLAEVTYGLRPRPDRRIGAVSCRPRRALSAGTSPSIGHVSHIEAGHRRERCRRNGRVLLGPAEGHLTRMGLGVGDELRESVSAGNDGLTTRRWEFSQSRQPA